jgi:hypothetical protein
MINVEAEGTTFKLISQISELTGLCIEHPSNTMNALFEKFKVELWDSVDTRIALFPNRYHTKQESAFFLVWQDGLDLKRMDERVRSGSSSDADFSFAFKTSLYKLHCFECHTKGTALTIDGGDPYLGNPDLLQKKFKKVKYIVCPNCGANLRQAVAKIVDWEIETSLDS